MMGPGLAGAEQRLLHPSVPAAFFGFALLAQVGFWGLLALASGHLPGFAGGIGLVLAAVHSLTLGVLLMTAVGATLQIMPVATLQGAPAPWLGWAIFLPLAGGAVVLPLGFMAFDPRLLALGTTSTAIGLGLYAIILGRLLSRARPDSLGTARGFLWLALVALGIFVALAGLLAAGNAGAVGLPAHGAVAATHLVLAGYGFMGLLALGFSHILIPMLALAEPSSSRTGQASLGIAAGALGAAAGGLLLSLPGLLMIAAGLGVIAVAFHLSDMHGVLAGRMRRRLPLGFRLIRLAWIMLPLSIAFGGVAAAGVLPDRLGLAFVATLLIGWLLSMTMGVLQQILPFLGSMHTMRGSHRPAMVSALTWERPLHVHFAGHVAGGGLVAAGILTGHVPLIVAGCIAGGVGATALALFGGAVVWRTRRHLHRHPLPGPVA